MSYVMSVLLYACETWTLRKRDIDSLMPDGILNILLLKNSPHTLAAENNEFREKTKA